MNTKLRYIGRALHAVCLLLCSHMAQSAVVATKCVAHASAYTVHEPHIQVPQQLNGDEARSVSPNRFQVFPKSPFRKCVQHCSVLEQHARRNSFNRIRTQSARQRNGDHPYGRRGRAH
jgi:hypothetical protein